MGRAGFPGGVIVHTSSSTIALASWCPALLTQRISPLLQPHSFVHTHTHCIHCTHSLYCHGPLAWSPVACTVYPLPWPHGFGHFLLPREQKLVERGRHNPSRSALEKGWPGLCQDLAFPGGPWAHTGRKQPAPDPGDPQGIFCRGREIPTCLSQGQGNLPTSLSSRTYLLLWKGLL